MKTGKGYILIFLSLVVSSSMIAQNGYFSFTYPNFDSRWGLSVHEIEDGNFLVVGTAEVNSIESIAIRKINGLGEIIWEKAIHQPDFHLFNTLSGSTIQTSDGNFITAGASAYEDTTYFYTYQADAMLVKFDANGDTLWIKKYADNSFTDGYFVAETLEQGFLLVGYHALPLPGEEKDILVIKTDINGNLEWQTVIGGNGELVDIGFSAIVEPDGGYLIGVGGKGDLSIGNPFYHTQVFKLDDFGDLEWEKTLGFGCASRIMQSSDNGYYLHACRDTIINNVFTESVNYLRKMDGNFELIWEVSFLNLFDINVWNARVLPNNNVIISGNANPDGPAYGYMAIVNTEGEIVLERTYYTNPDFNNYFTDMIPTSDGGYIATGSARTEDLAQATWLVKLDSVGCLIPGCDSVITSVISPALNVESILIFPNPANETVTLHWAAPTISTNQGKVHIYNALGQKIQTLPLFTETIEVSVSGYPPGMYYIEISDSNSVKAIGRFVKIE